MMKKIFLRYGPRLFCEEKLGNFAKDKNLQSCLMYDFSFVVYLKCKKNMAIFGREICTVSVIDMPAPVYHVRYTILPTDMPSGCGGSVIETYTSCSLESCSYYCAKHNIECRAYSYTEENCVCQLYWFANEHSEMSAQSMLSAFCFTPQYNGI